MIKIVISGSSSRGSNKTEGWVCQGKKSLEVPDLLDNSVIGKFFNSIAGDKG
jgi:hypothetical protein